MYLDSTLPFNYPEDKAIKLYNSIEDGGDEWTEFLSTQVKFDGKMVYIDELVTDSMIEEISDVSMDLLIDTLSREIEMSYEVQLDKIIEVEMPKLSTTDIIVYALIRVKPLEKET